MSATGIAARLIRAIKIAGPISIAQYMAESNAHYYASRDPLGADGDFITAPEISQMFGELIGLWITDLWLRAGKPANCLYVEFGPGRGTLARDALRAMAKFGLTPGIHFIETSPALRAKQSALHPGAIFHDDMDTLPDDRPLLVVANEFFDALPIRQMIATPGGWRERVVAHDGHAFIPLPGDRPMDAAAPEQFAAASPGTILESCPAASAIAAEMARRVKAQGGAALCIDYGYTQSQSGSSLQAVAAHEKVDAFAAPGNMDLTAHVNFAELAQIGAAHDVRVSGPVSQGDWLKAMGIDARAEVLKQHGRAEDITAAHHRLTAPEEMGALFKVLAYSAAHWPTPTGFE